MTRRRPEILAPAGDRAALRAALSAGADAVYFGLDDGFNARARAANFSRENLPEVMAEIHRAGARGYLTLNTLVFEAELPAVAELIVCAALAGVDALIVQDPAVAVLAAAICPQLELHASTQMTISSPEGARFAEALGVTRVVVPRELSVAEIRRFAAGTSLELEVFIHGALCVSWSGQCLTSEAWGGRSANRGQCAQSCRMPYELLVDGRVRPLGEVAYLLSPGDLAGAELVPELCDVGVHGLKIEGRLKGPAYVSTAVEGYSRWLDAVERGPTPADAERLRSDLSDMDVVYSRGFSEGFLRGSDHQTLVQGRFPKHRGRLLGRVTAVDAAAGKVTLVPDASGRTPTGGLALDRSPTGESVVPCEPAGPALSANAPRAGMGVVFDRGRPEEREPGGPIFSVEPQADGALRLGFGRPGPDLHQVGVGDRVWLNSDPALTRQGERHAATEAVEGRNGVSLRVAGRAGEPLRIQARCGAASATTTSEGLLVAAASGPGMTAALLTEKLAAFGGTPFRLSALDVEDLEAGLHLPVSELKRLRRTLVAALLPALERGVSRHVDRESWRALATMEPSATVDLVAPNTPPRLVVMCRTDAHLEAAIAAGLPEVELDYMEMVGLGRAVSRARAAGLSVTLATVRVQKPGEQGYDERLARLLPDAVLVRHWGGLMTFAAGLAGREGPRPVVHGDFSLNVTNSVTFRRLLDLGLSTVTVAHDLDAAQVLALLSKVPAERAAVTVHHHIPTFHTEHCVYAHLLSRGQDYRTCGRPCEAHAIALRDRTGRAHPVTVDVGCRNTVFNAEAQSAASLAPRLLSAGVRRFRVELVREPQAVAAEVIAAWQALLAGRIEPAELLRRTQVNEQFGVTAGTMRILGA